MARLLILLAAVTISTCLGATYSWSVFVGPLKELTGLGQGAVQLPFSTFYVAFPATMILSGMLISRLGPRRCAVLGGIFFGGGWMLAGLGGRHFGFTLAGIGLLGGIGVGFAYIVPISTLILWFPRHKGLITGIAVAGFGGGAALVAKTADHLMSARGWTPFEAFRVFGACFLILIVLLGLALRNPPELAVGRIAPREGDPLGERIFWVLYLAMFAGLAAGFAVNANLKQLYQGREARAGVAAVVVFALANAGGRIGWGFAFDHLRSATAIRLNLALQAAVMLGSAGLLRSAAGLQLFALLAGLNYGGVLVIYASTTARRWGSERVGPIYGWLFSANIPAALAPVLVGRAFDHWGSFIFPLSAIGVLLLAVALVFRMEEIR